MFSFLLLFTLGSCTSLPRKKKQASAGQDGKDAAGANRHPSGGASESPSHRANPPASAPREYVVGLYNAYAETFDSHLQEALEYRTPSAIVESLAVLFPGRR